MDPILFYAIVFALGAVGAFVGSVAAGAGLITVPGLLLLGVPPHTTLGSHKFASLGFRIGSFINYYKYKKIIWDLVPIYCVLGAIGAAIGTSIVVELDEKILTSVIGIVLIALLPTLYMKSDTGTVRKKISIKRRRFAHIGYFFAQMWAGFFSPGSGFIGTYLSVHGYGLTILQGKGTTRIPLMVSELTSSIIFFTAMFIDWKIAIPLFLGQFVGSYAGSKLAVIKGDAWIKPIMAVIIIISGIKMIFF